MESLYFKNSFVSIYYDKEHRLGKAVWNGSLVGSEYREAILICADLVDRHGLIAWLADDRKMKTINPADLQWSLEVYVPQLLESPLRRMATLPSEYEEQRQAVEQMVDKRSQYDHQILVRNFYDEKEAMAWLLGADRKSQKSEQMLKEKAERITTK
jgi:hypothetical protein